jgi:ABC-type phosphate transport system auxiliary subunit
MTPVMTHDPAVLLEEIGQLLAAPGSGAEAPELARVEETLTSGYARALALEAERWRLERKLGEIAGKLRGAENDLHTAELAALADRMAVADGELAHLRGLLATLRTRAFDLRVSQTA